MEGKDTNVTTKAMTAEELEKKLSKEVGVEVDYSTITPANFIKFLVFSGLGVWVFFINTTIGGKTGTTKGAGNCLILLTKDSSGNPYISIIMGAGSKPLLYQDMTSMLSKI